MRDSERLDRIAARQLGLFTRAQALACGFSPYQVRHRLHSGEWQRIAGPVCADRGRRIGRTGQAAAAHLATPGSVVAGPSAAVWYGSAEGGTTTYLWVGPTRRCPLPGVRVFRDPLAGSDIRRADGMLITGPERTVFDSLRVLPDDAALKLLDRALQKRWTSLPELARRVRGHAGRRDAPRLVRLVRMAAEGTRSAAERRTATLLRRAGIRGWRANAPIHDGAGLIGYGDLVFHEARLVVELDGWAYHSDQERFQRDRTRQNRLVAAGWTVLRFTWHDLTDRPAEVVTTIRAMLSS